MTPDRHFVEPRSGLRSAVDWTCRGALLVLTLCTLFAFLEELNWRMEIFSHLRLHYAIAATLLILPLLCLGRRLHATVAGAVMVINGMVVLLPYPGLTLSAAASTNCEAPLRVVAFNVYFLNKDYAATIRFLRGSEADIVVLEEIRPPWIDQALEPLKDIFPYQISQIGAGRADGLAILSRYPMSRSVVLHPGGGGKSALIAIVKIGQRSVSLVAVHPRSPIFGERKRERDRYLAELAGTISQIKRPVIAAGDFNTTPWASPYKYFVDIGGMRPGPWSGATWPAGFGFAGIPLDHVLGRNGAVVHRTEVGPRLGSDHRPLTADLCLE